MWFSIFSLSLLGQTWKIEAQQSINQYRKAPIHISVFDQAGNPVDDIPVTIRMQKHLFRWGTTSSISHIRNLEQQFGVQLGDNHPYMLHFRHFNSVTPENAGKWNFWRQESSRSKYLETLSWFDQLGIANRGHTTIWPSITRWGAVPAFVVNATSKTENGVVIKTREEVIREHVRNHIENQLTILEPYIYEMDLVNELVNEGEIVKMLLNLPPEQRPREHAEWYKWAKAAAPNIDLVANEYNLFQSGNNFHQRFAEYVNAMLTAGAPIDAVGMQGHFFGDMPSFSELKKRLAEVAVLNLPMSVTEFDMKGSSYADMERVLYAIFSEPLVYGFSMWGAWDGRQWRNNSAMFSEDWQLKPSGQAWMDLVKDVWWTDTVLTTVNGAVSTSGFLGDYDIFVENDGMITMSSTSLSKDGLDLQLVVGDASFTRPEATMVIAGGERSEFYANEPIDVKLHSADSILSVTYFVDDLIHGVYERAPFEMLLRLLPEEKKSVHAKIEFSSGFELTTAKQSVSATLTNQAPTIQSIFPPSGSTWLMSDVTYLFVEASDVEGDSLTFKLQSFGSDNVLSVRDPAPIPLTDVVLGSNYFTVRVEDDKYGFSDQFYFLNFVEDGIKQIAQGASLEADDDIEEKNDGAIDINGDLDIGEKLVGIRFPLVSIPPGSTIDSAFVQFTSQKAEQTGIASCEISAELSTAASPFSGSNGDLSSREKTELSVQWDMADWDHLDERSVLQKTPDLETILNQLINQDSWTDSSRVHLFFQSNGSVSKRSAYSTDQVPEHAPQLIVHYRSDFSVQDPEPPFAFSFEQTSSNTGLLRWNEPDALEILGYHIFINDTLPLLARDPSFELKGLKQGVEYRVTGTTIGSRGAESILSEPFMFDLGTVSTSDPRNQLALSIWPNPSRERLFLKIASNRESPMKYNILAQNGQILQKGVSRTNEFSLDVSGLIPGIYYLNLIDNAGHSTLRKWTKL